MRCPLARPAAHALRMYHGLAGNGTGIAGHRFGLFARCRSCSSHWRRARPGVAAGVRRLRCALDPLVRRLPRELALRTDDPRLITLRVDPGVPVFSLGRYVGARRTAIVAAKERGRSDLIAPLAQAMGEGVDRLVAWTIVDEPLKLVPAPTRRSAARRRGGDPVTRIAVTVAAARLRGRRRTRAAHAGDGRATRWACPPPRASATSTAASSCVSEPPATSCWSTTSSPPEPPPPSPSASCKPRVRVSPACWQSPTREEQATGVPNGWHGMVNRYYRRGQEREPSRRPPQQARRHLPTAVGGEPFDLWPRWWRNCITSTPRGSFSTTGHAGIACNWATETSCQACQADPWNQTKSWPTPTSSPSRTGRRGGRQGPQRRDSRPLPRLRLGEAGPPGTVRPHHLPVRRRTGPREEPAPTQELPARRDHRARPRTRGSRRSLRRQLLRRSGVGGRQAREPAAPQQGPPQDPLRRQDPGVAGRGHRGRPAARAPAPAEPSRRAGRRSPTTTTSPAASCAPRSTRRHR